MDLKIEPEDSVFSTKTTINCKGILLDISQPKVMGILNATPDSFYDGGKNKALSDALHSAEKMVKDGVDIIDIGGHSTRPNATEVAEDEEMQRVLPIIEKIHQEFPHIPISIDSFRASVCEMAVNAGAAIINDISGGSFDKKMFSIAAKLNVPYILSHIKGNLSNMQKKPEYENVMEEIIYYFSKKVNELHKLGVNDIILDPGFGFGKTTAHNYTILKNLKAFSMFGLTVMVGFSRKGMIWKVLDTVPQKALNGTSVAHTLALIGGAKILRVHDVKEAKEAIQIVSYWQKH